MRKEILFLFLAACPCVAFSAEVREKILADDEQRIEEGKKIVGTLIDRYATVAGGWYLEKKCDFLSEDLKKEFENDVAANTVRMHYVLNVSEDTLHKIQGAGKETAAQKRWKCDNKGRDIVVTSVNLARKLRAALEEMERVGVKKSAE